VRRSLVCRLLAVATKETLRPEWLKAFAQLAKSGKTARNDYSGHPDGWGVVRYHGGRPRYLAREPINILGPRSSLPRVLKTVGRVKIPFIIAHIRKSSRGKRSIENTHPFVCGKWAFAHNGTLQRAEEMPLRKYALEGDTDSERLFKFLLERIEDEAIEERPKAIKSALALIRHFNSLTFLMSDGERLYAYRGVKAISDTPRTRERLEYYNLRYALSGESLIVCSEEACFRGLIDAEWRELANGKLLVADLTSPFDRPQPILTLA